MKNVFLNLGYRQYFMKGQRFTDAFTLCSGLVSDKRVFPTKDNNWVSLEHKPLISDSKEFEKVFRHHKQVLLLNLPPAEKKATHTRTQNCGTLLLFIPHMDVL